MSWSSRCILLMLISCSYCFDLPPTYDASSRPTNGGVADIVNVSIQVISIGQINENESTFALSFILRSFWKDKRLENLVERETIFVDSKVPPVWTPSFSILDIARNELVVSNELSSTNLKLKANGVLEFSRRYSVVLYCRMSLFKYPFGRQSCELKLTSNGYTTVHLTLLWHGLIASTNGLNSVDAIPVYDSKYSLQSIDQAAWREVHQSVGQISFISVTFHLLRNPVAELARVFLPTLLFAVASYLITFFMFSSGHFQKNLMLVVSVNCIFLLLTVIISQITFVTKSPSTLTCLDLWTGMMFFFQLVCLMMSLVRTASNRNFEVAESTGGSVKHSAAYAGEINHRPERSSRLFQFMRVGIPVIFVLSASTCTYALFRVY